LGKKEIFLQFNIKDKVNYYENWTYSWVRAVSEWLQEVTCDTMLCTQALILTTMCQHNEEFKTVYKTFILLLFWVEAKQGVRDRAWHRLVRLAPCLYHIYRASNHPKVAQQMLLLIWQQEALPKEVFEALMEHSTGSISGAHPPAYPQSSL
jgi:hypothetical protein